jgi:hypothetical protein
MALLERLQILVDGNASGAIREFQKVGAVADRELGRTEDKLAKISNQLTSFGTGLLAGSAVAAVGLSLRPRPPASARPLRSMPPPGSVRSASRPD